MGYASYIVFSNRHRLDNPDIKAKYGELYSNLKTEGRFAKWDTIFQLGHKSLTIVLVVALHNSEWGQVWTLFVSNAGAAVWNVLVRPQERWLSTAAVLASNGYCIIANGIYCGMCNSGLDDTAMEAYGDAVMYLFFASVIVASVFGLAKIVQDLFVQFTAVSSAVLPMSSTMAACDLSKVKEPVADTTNEKKVEASDLVVAN